MSRETGISHTDSSPELFDDQAESFDRRTGLPEECCRAVAEQIVGYGGEHGLIVEVGCGTGQIGQWLEGTGRYVGFDFSINMLAGFWRRSDPPLLQADANATWPFADGAASVVFSSRAMHLLNQEHVAAEIFRVASPEGATVVLGRVERTPGSVRERLAQEMNRRLSQRGLKGRRGERRNRRLFEACERLGAEPLEPIPVMTWKTAASPRQSLDMWHGLKGLGGIAVPAETKSEVLDELRVWALETFGGLDEQFEFEETYVLSPVRVPPTQRRTSTRNT